MKLIVTIYEETFDAALAAIRALDADHDGIELRAETLGAIDLAALRAATPKLVILTHRGRHVDEATIEDAIAAGIDLIDVEWHDALDRDVVARHRERVVLSHHDYEATPDVDALLATMLSFGAAQTKLAVTPRSYRDNQRLLEAMRAHAGRGVTTIGMGARGLYSRILAPWFGSELQFVAKSEERSAAPGQLTLARALDIYGDRDLPSDPKIFAVIGNPAAHSLSPSIHNRLFRERGLVAAYTIFDTDAFDEIVWPFAAGAKLSPVGLSITAPFKEEAFRFAMARGATIAPNARESGAVNTLVRLSDREILADNTDVDGFASLLRAARGRAAIVGAGGTARAALVALRRAGFDVTLYNRTVEKARVLHDDARPLEELPRFEGDVIVNTLTSGVAIELPLHPVMTLVEAAYAHGSTHDRGHGDGTREAVPQQPATSDQRPLMNLQNVTHFTGIDLLQAQAVRQNELFRKVFDESR
jgi:shikimate dehydrogenase/3-dehydroquinate dehydratase type I